MEIAFDNLAAAFQGAQLTERARIVEWLRTAEHNTNTNWGACLALRIERGDHLKAGD